MNIVELDTRGRLTLPSEIRSKVKAKKCIVVLEGDSIRLIPLMDLPKLKGLIIFRGALKNLKKLVNSLSPKEMLKGRFLLDADVFLSYIGGGLLVDHAEKIIKLIADRMIETFVSSMLYDNVISALCSKGLDINSVIQVLVVIASIPHNPLPTTL
ncbi:MAG: hypothetical protein H5T50_04640 [Nitrososphaeria archaeon]|nr:hypothetical protein [Nitrososphaeria archaeon]